MTLKLNNAQARHLVLHLQGLTGVPNRKMNPADLYDLILRLGFVQVDSIQWVERAQHMILLARNQTYRPKMLKRLIETERLLFEGWTHDASIIPSEFYPYWRHRFDRRREKTVAQFRQWQGEGYTDHCEVLLERIAENGPLRSRDLERPDTGKQEMWQWHDGKAALEFLWYIGALCISAREGFQKVYDLAENGIPAEHFEARVGRDEFIDWACRSAIERLGFGSAGDIARYWDHVSVDEVKDWISALKRDHLILMEVETALKSTRSVLVRPDLTSIQGQLNTIPNRIRVLSPFDPVIRDRKRLEWLFGFDYRIEIYVPAEKRKWGYYIFPLLEGDRLIGRIDMRADRKAKALAVRKLWLEPKVKFGNDRRKRLDGELIRQARLCDLPRIIWDDGALDEIA
ncbi:MAG: winged helix-turn-helix domain-containing protein [Rhizobiaceae bacterium]